MTKLSTDISKKAPDMQILRAKGRMGLSVKKSLVVLGVTKLGADC